MKHKFINRKTGKVIYYGQQGKETFEKMPQSDEYKYAGAISDEEFEEIQKANSTSKKEIIEESLSAEKYNEVLTSNIVELKELTEDEVDNLVSGKQVDLTEDEVEKPKKKLKTKTLDNEQAEEKQP
jgi:DNA-directed RNA polymerase subunit F